jgi:outer membrane protein TolC
MIADAHKVKGIGMTRTAALGFLLFCLLLASHGLSQSAPASPDRPWHSSVERGAERDAERTVGHEFAVDPSATYSLAELVDLAESHNPDTRAAWQHARSQAAALGVTRAELFPTLAVSALSKTSRVETYLNTRYIRQTFQSFDLALDLRYLVFDAGARSGRIDAAKAELLGANFAFNDVHSRLIYRIASTYYQLENAAGLESTARASLANAQAVQQSAEASLKNGLATLPDVLEARSSTAQAEYDLQAALGAEDVARGNLATALGASPTESISVRPIDQVAIPDGIEGPVEKAIDRAIRQRPDLMEQIEAIRVADAQLKQARAAYFPTLSVNGHPDAQSLYGLQQQLPWGHTAGLDGDLTFNFNWTIFDGGARKNQVAEAKSVVLSATEKADSLRDQIENGVWTAYSNLKTALRQRQAAQALLDASNQSYNAAIESYRYGVRNLLDVTEAQRTLARARSADVLARTQVLTALAALAFETGDTVQPGHPRPQP